MSKTIGSVVRPDSIRAVAAHDGVVAVATSDYVEVFDGPKRLVARRCKYPTSVAFSPSGEQLAIVSNDGATTVWRYRSAAEPLTTPNPFQQIWSQHLRVGWRDEFNLELWGDHSYWPLRIAENRLERIGQETYMSGESEVVLAVNAEAVCLLLSREAATIVARRGRQTLGTVSVSEVDSIRQGSVSDDGSLGVYVYDDLTLLILDLAAGRVARASLPTGFGGSIVRTAASRSAVAAWTDGGQLHVFDAEGLTRGSVDIGTPWRDGRQVLVSTGSEFVAGTTLGRVEVIDIGTAASVATLQTRRQAPARRAWFSSKGSLACAFENGELSLGYPSPTTTLLLGRVDNAAWFPNDDRIAIDTGASIVELRADGQLRELVSTSRDSSPGIGLLAAGEDRLLISQHHVQVVRIENGASEQLSVDPAASGVFLSNGSTVTASTVALALFGPENELISRNSHKGFTLLASGLGDDLVAAASPQQVLVFRAGPLRLDEVGSIDQAGVNMMAWSPSGRSVALGLRREIVQWHWQTGVVARVRLERELLALGCSDERVLAYLLDGKVVEFTDDDFLKDGADPPPGASVLSMPSVASQGDEGGADAPPTSTGSSPDGEEIEVDAPASTDRLGVTPVARALARCLVDLTERWQSGARDLDHPAVLIAGEWGSGKSSLLQFVQKELPPSRWTVVRYDAWCESVVAPKWFGVLGALRKCVRGDTPADRFGFRMREIAFRLRRRNGLLGVAGFGALSAMLLVVSSWLGSSSAKSVLELPTAILAVVAAATAAWNVVSWDVPRGADLKMRSDSDPLREVELLSKWLRAQAGRARRSDRFITIITVACVVSAVIVAWSTRWTRNDVRSVFAPSWAYISAVLILSFVAACVSAAFSRAEPGQRLGSMPLLAGIGMLVAGALASTFLESRAPWRETGEAAQLLACVGAFCGLLVAFQKFVSDKGGTPHHVILVIDNLDRCSATEVAEVLDLLGTVFRAPRSSSDELAFITVVLADDKWLAKAYDRRHGASDTKQNQLGWRFLAKHFDLAIRVPTASDESLADLVSWKRLGISETLEPNGQSHTFIRSDESQPGFAERQSDDVPEASEPATLETVEAEFTEHILESFVSLADKNPRAVRRATNHYAFLRRAFPNALDPDLLARSAYLLAARPWLVETPQELLARVGVPSVLVAERLLAVLGLPSEGSFETEHSAPADDGGDETNSS